MTHNHNIPEMIRSIDLHFIHNHEIGIRPDPMNKDLNIVSISHVMALKDDKDIPKVLDLSVDLSLRFKYVLSKNNTKGSIPISNVISVIFYEDGEIVESDSVLYKLQRQLRIHMTKLEKEKDLSNWMSSNKIKIKIKQYSHAILVAAINRIVLSFETFPSISNAPQDINIYTIFILTYAFEYDCIQQLISNSYRYNNILVSNSKTLLGV